MSLVHWVLVLVIVLLVFGPMRLGAIGKGLGQGIRKFREGLASDAEASDSREEGKGKSEDPKTD